ncbi:hypothetical protein F5B21DRAFT_65340 [Xylaria acuta]|nr:hypothetical protein F5B21DRAFT_65340 [Xylaria acuta]
MRTLAEYSKDKGQSITQQATYPLTYAFNTPFPVTWPPDASVTFLSAIHSFPTNRAKGLSIYLNFELGFIALCGNVCHRADLTQLPKQSFVVYCSQQHSYDELGRVDLFYLVLQLSALPSSKPSSAFGIRYWQDKGLRLRTIVHARRRRPSAYTSTHSGPLTIIRGISIGPDRPDRYYSSPWFSSNPRENMPMLVPVVELLWLR